MNEYTQQTIANIQIAMSGVSNNNRLAIMIGANTFGFHRVDNDVTFSFKYRGGNRKFNTCAIKYDSGKDLFEMRLYRVNSKTFEISEIKHSELFVDQLKTLFEQSTNLYLTL